jgi:hypothetical protein
MLSVVCAILTCLQPARAETAVDLELALGIDVSRSVDLAEAKLQREGYIQAFRDPEVIRAITGGMLGRIAVGYYEWAGFGYAKVVVGWTLIDGEASAHAFADALVGNLPQSARRTSISEAIDFAIPWFDGNGFSGARRVVDLSGDGPNNWGDLVTVARDKAVAAGITINGLPILNRDSGFYSRYNIPELDLYYRDCVIGGPGAFFVVANNFADFARAVRRKLILEIAGGRPPAGGPGAFLPVQAGPGARVSPPCDIGERILRSRDDF